MNIYGFRMVNHHVSVFEVQHKVYYHPLMIRGKPNMCCGMVRQKVKGNQASRTIMGESSRAVAATSQAAAAAAAGSDKHHLGEEQQHHTYYHQPAVQDGHNHQETTLTENRWAEESLLDFAISANQYLDQLPNASEGSADNTEPSPVRPISNYGNGNISNATKIPFTKAALGNFARPENFRSTAVLPMSDDLFSISPRASPRVLMEGQVLLASPSHLALHKNDAIHHHEDAKSLLASLFPFW